MTVRPPTLREKRRYLLVRILPSGITPDPKDLYYAVFEAGTSLWGDGLMALIHPAVIEVKTGFAVIRCRRGMERELLLALSTVCSCKGEPIALRTLSTSGTIDTLRGRMTRQPPDPCYVQGPADFTFDHRHCAVSWCEGEKVDVIEKGFKNTTRFYLTKDDLEDT